MELEIPLDAFVLVSVGELNKNKNNSVVIRALERLNNPNIHYILCGTGERAETLKIQVNKANLQDNVHFLGYRTDVREIYTMSDCFVMPSRREGLSRSLMEAMACGLPCIASKIRGNSDLLEGEEGGFLCNPNSVMDFSSQISGLIDDSRLQQKMSKHNLIMVEKFNINAVLEKMYNIYKNVLYMTV